MSSHGLVRILIYAYRRAQNSALLMLTPTIYNQLCLGSPNIQVLFLLYSQWAYTWSSLIHCEDSQCFQGFVEHKVSRLFLAWCSLFLLWPDDGSPLPQS